MKILITGGTGLIGRALAKELVLRGHQIVVLTRKNTVARSENLLPFPHEIIEGDLTLNPIPELAQKGIEAIVHLLGESLGQRWTTEVKTRIYRSRVDSTENLKKSFGAAWDNVRVFVGASSIGYYGDAADKALNEMSPRGRGFLSELCGDWEAAQSEIQHMNANLRLVTLRIGLVLAREGGILRRLLPTFLAHLGGNLGSGQQWQSWIHVDDLVRLVSTALEDDRFVGVFNAVSPEPVRNKRVTLELERVLNVVGITPLPMALLEMLYGETSDILLMSQRVYPHKAHSLGFSFKYSLLKMALQNILGHYRSGEKELVNERYFAESIDAVKAKVLGREGVEASHRDYQFHIGKVRLFCRAVLEENPNNDLVIERQTKGPYKTWSRSVEFRSIGHGVIVKETIRFGFKMRWLSNLLGAKKIVEQHLQQLN